MLQAPKKTGFTIVEILVVISIIAILASLLMVTESQVADLQNGGRVQDTRPAAEMTLFPWGEPITPRTASYPMGAAPRPEGGAP